MIEVPAAGTSVPWLVATSGIVTADRLRHREPVSALDDGLHDGLVDGLTQAGDRDLGGVRVGGSPGSTSSSSSR